MLPPLLSLGCLPTAGPSFPHGKVATLSVGDELDPRGAFGEPTEEAHSVDSNGAHYRQIRYVFSRASWTESPHVRVLLIETRDGTINGFIYASGFPVDETTIPEGLLESSRGMQGTAVSRRWGPPDGVIRCPTHIAAHRDTCASEEVRELWLWHALQPAPHNALRARRIELHLGTDGTIRSAHAAEETIP